jgi:hypothetical protein
MRPLDAVLTDATALFGDAAALIHRARGIRQELQGAPAAGVDEAERLVHGTITPRAAGARPSGEPDPLARDVVLDDPISDPRSA